MTSVGVDLDLVSHSQHAAPLKLLTLFVLLSGIPLVALGWLGWRVLQQDRALESQRLRERLDNAASLVAREVDRGLTAWEELLPVAASGHAVTLPSESVFLLITAHGVVQQQGVPLPYYPRVAAAITASASLFAAAERQEFREHNLAAAIAAYRSLAASNDPSIRAGALMRLARCFRKQALMSEALTTYAGLAALRDVSVAGSPAELVARRERIALFTAMGNAGAAAHERTLLTSALVDARFHLDRTTFDYFDEAASVSTTRPPASGAGLADAVEAMWPTWREQPPDAPTGRVTPARSSRSGERRRAKPRRGVAGRLLDAQYVGWCAERSPRDSNGKNRRGTYRSTADPGHVSLWKRAQMVAGQSFALRRGR